MKKKMLVLCSLITLILAAFQFPIYADEDPSDSSSISPIPNSIRLDSYFYENYDLLPYIEGTGQQYINLGVSTDSSYVVDITVSDFKFPVDSNCHIFGSRDSTGNYSLISTINDNSQIVFNIAAGTEVYSYTSFEPYLKYRILIISNEISINNVVRDLEYSSFSNSKNLYVFGFNPSSVYGSFKLYNLSILDPDTNNYIRYFYPDKSKSGGIVGLYDAVSDTFYTSGSAVFTSPVNDYVLNFQIGNFVTSSLGWIADILEFAITTPIILVFIAIGLAGAMFRWGRRLVHF